MAMTEEMQIRISAQDQASAPLKNVKDNVDKVSASAKNTSNAMRKMQGGMSNLGRSAGQAGIQVQQLVGQIQMGTNPMIALSQQAADLGFVLGVPLLGAITGIAASIGAVFIPSLFEAKKTMAELDEQSRKLGTTLRAIAPTLYGEEAEKGIAKITELGQKQIDIFNQLSAAETKAAETKAKYDAAQAKVNEALAAGLVPEAQALLNANELQIAYQKDQSAAYNLRVEYEKLGVQLLDTNAQFAHLSGMMDENKEASKGVERSQEKLVNKFRESQIGLEAFVKDTDAVNQNLMDMWHITDNTTQSVDRFQLQAKKTAMSLAEVKENGVNALEDSLVDFMMKTKSASEAFKSMARSIISDMIRMSIQRSITAPLMNALFPVGGTYTTVSGSSSPTVGNPDVHFEGGGYTGSGSRSGGVDGKGGFPAILHPNETVIDHSKGQSMGGSPISITLNISTGVSQTVRAEIANLLPQITNAAKSAVADARQRGGGYSKALVGG